jgi:hypothetical protein
MKRPLLLPRNLRAGEASQQCSAMVQKLPVSTASEYAPPSAFSAVKQAGGSHAFDGANAAVKRCLVAPARSAPQGLPDKSASTSPYAAASQVW